MRGLSCTQGTVRLVRQAVKGLRRVGSCALGPEGRHGRWDGRPSARLDHMQHDAEPYVDQQSKLGLDHGVGHPLRPTHQVKSPNYL